jgi:hypothetical protein
VCAVCVSHETVTVSGASSIERGTVDVQYDSNNANYPMYHGTMVGIFFSITET